MIPVPQAIADYVELLNTGTPFTHTNAGGDGEFLTITGWRGTNSDGHESTVEKGDALAKVILEPRLTFHGYNPGKPESEKRSNAELWLRDHGVNVPLLSHTSLTDPDYGTSKVNVRWVHKEIISTANVRGEWGAFLKALKNRSLLAVGPHHICNFAAGKLGGSAVTFPLDWGWDKIERIRTRVEAKLLDMPTDTVVTWSLGYIAKVLTWKLAPCFPGLTMIDLGACFDPYCGVLNRHGYKADTWPDAMRKNLEGLA
jgi:hypothetical protein